MRPPTLDLHLRRDYLSSQIIEIERSLYAQRLKLRVDSSLGDFVDRSVIEETTRQIEMLETVLKVYHEEWFEQNDPGTMFDRLEAEAIEELSS